MCFLSGLVALHGLASEMDFVNVSENDSVLVIFLLVLRLVSWKQRCLLWCCWVYESDLLCLLSSLNNHQVQFI